MKAVDTNIVVRFLLNDDPEQGALAAQVMAAGAFVSLTVVLEAAWVIEGLVGRKPALAADLVASLLDVPTVSIAHAPLVEWALDRYRAGADFSDMLHLVSALDAGTLVTFDRKLARQAGPNAPTRVETIR